MSMSIQNGFIYIDLVDGSRVHLLAANITKIIETTSSVSLFSSGLETILTEENYGLANAVMLLEHLGIESDVIVVPE